MEEIDYKGLHFTVWDIGGQTKIRGMWHYYYDQSDAIIYVLDTSDKERFELAKETLQSVIVADELKKCPVLVLANKIDVSRMPTTQIV